MAEYINNSVKRKETLKDLIRQLHEGKTVDEVKADFARLLDSVGASEIAEIEQTLIAEGLPEMEVKRLCDVHVAVFRESLDAEPAPETTPGHPVHTFRAENEAAGIVLDELQRAIEALEGTPDQAAWRRARTLLDTLREYEKHYLRKENILFPYLEKHGFAGPSSVMWAIHDDIRAGWKALGQALAAGQEGDDPAAATARVRDAFEPLATAIREMFYKEANILYPTSLQKLSDEEWMAIRDQESELGYSFIRPGDEWAPQATAPEPVSLTSAEKAIPGATGLLPLETGALTVDQLNLLLSHLPVDITFVDAEDTVRFFSHGQDRVFPRSPAVIGRKVQKCHPPNSIHRVQEILNDFRAGDRDVADFWVQLRGRFVYIAYYAMRDAAGAYQGTLEVVQDITSLRALEGERRLLDNKE